MKALITLILFFSLSSAESAVTASVFKLDELQGLLPSFWLDHTGFSLEDEPRLDFDIPSSPVLPLLPLYSSGGFGKNVYVGGIIEEKYLLGLSSFERSLILKKLMNMQGPDGIRFRVVDMGKKIFAIRSDYQVQYSKVTTVGLSFGFGGGKTKTVDLGETKIYGLKLDIGAPFRISPEKGVNILGSIQETIDDWSVGLGPDETSKIVDQSVAIAPALVKYISEKPISLRGDNGIVLDSIPAKKNEILDESGSQVTMEKAGSFSKELKKIQKDIQRNLKKEVLWKNTVKPQVQAEKVVSRDSMNESIQRICDRLATIYEVPAEVWPRCKVSATLVPNAWAYPGGDIFISTGLLSILSEIDSVALVLGHEIGHVMARHISKQAPVKKTYDYAATILSTVVNVGVTGFSLGGGWGALGNVNFLSWYPQALASYIGGAYLGQKGLEIASFAPMAGIMLLSREHEMQADRIGQEVAYASGSELSKMNKGWGEFVSFFDDYFPRELGIKEKIMQDHPSNEKRLVSLEKRSIDLNKRLADLQLANAFTESDRTEYQRIHKGLKPYGHAYGKALREKFNSIEKGKSRFQKELKLKHFIHTITGPHGRCIRHALGAQ